MRKKIYLLFAVAAITVSMMACQQQSTTIPATDVTITDTPVVEPTTEPTTEPVVTVEPAEQPEADLTATPVITATEAPTETPTPTPTVTPTSTPVPSPTNTPIPTSIPTQGSTPTPFPTPDPENPKMLASYKGDKNYGDVTIELWDNGYMYITGTGTVNTDAICGIGYTSPDCKEFIRICNLSKADAPNYVIGEGIVDLDDWAWLPSAVTYLELPSTLKEVSGEFASSLRRNPRDVKIIGYKDGKKVTYEYKAGEDFSKV